MDAAEYAVRKVVQNNPIREVDEVRQREMWQWVSMSVILVLVLLASTWLRGDLLRHGYDMQKLQDERAADQETNRQLRLDIDMLSSPKRIEDFATRRLRMVAPGLSDAFVLHRIVAPQRPPSSVVAAR